MPRYHYRKPGSFDSEYLGVVLRKEFGDNFLGWSETPSEMRIEFRRELTPEEKSKLDSIIANPPTPAAVYEFGDFDIEDEIERTIGVRPVHVRGDSRTGTYRIIFDRPLTQDQEKALSNLLSEIKSKGMLKRRK
jgi:hypothetical protein